MTVRSGSTLATAACLAALTVTTSPAHAGGSRDLADAWLISPPALWSVAPEGHRRLWWVTLASGRLYGLAELPQWRLEAAVIRPVWRATIAWERLGGDLLCEDSARAAFGFGQRWWLGLQAGVDRQTVTGVAARDQVALAVRAGGPLASGLTLEVELPVRGIPPWYGETGLRRWARLEATTASWAWALAVDRAASGRPALQGEISIRVAPTAALGLRGDPWSGSIGLNTAWWVKVGWLRSSHLVHPDLGITHRWALILGCRRQEQP